jgi:16S rRNA (uracil1498-N3)-methyltransferase
LHEGSCIEVIDGDGKCRDGILVHVAGDRVEVALSGEAKAVANPVPVTVAVALVKKGLDDALRQLVEIGVARVVPLLTARSVKGLTPRSDRWAHVTAEAQKQCGRALALVIEPLRTLPEFLSEAREGTRFFADVGAKSLLTSLASAQEPPFTITIGPEGGFTEDERGAFLAAGFQPVGIGKFILRTETAAVAAAAVLSHAALARESSSP